MLVERIINKVINEKIDIDKILVVTFTNAAAAEMRERILDKIYRLLDEFPEDKHLQRQILLLNKASICTIDSFCLEVVRNNFYNINLSPNFKIGDNTEIEILKLEALENVLEKKYEQNSTVFEKVVNTYVGYRGDEKLKDIILKIYNFIQSFPYPYKYLKENVELFNIEEEADFKNTIWGSFLLEQLKEDMKEVTEQLIEYKKLLEVERQLDKYLEVVKEYINIFMELENNLVSWDSAYEYIKKVEFTRFPSLRTEFSFKDNLRECLKEIRERFDDYKKIIGEKSLELSKELFSMYEILLEINDIVLKLEEEFKKIKQEKNLVDFSDIEHYALELLEGEAKEQYKKKFEEILIDEYQDSNLVQENILKSISRGNNIFMVGDVKQSIYKFRQAMPELFLEKYNSYGTENGIKIKLLKNFRSRDTVLNFVNFVFKNIMSKELGDIAYNEDEFLNLGADYKPSPDFKPELHIINVGVAAHSYPDLDDNIEITQNIELEARLVANRIKELIDSNKQIKFKDIVILLRSTSNNAKFFEKAIKDMNYPVFSDVTDTYLESVEINTIMSLLKIIDNPLDDISLITVLRSPIGNFTDNELLEIRLNDKNSLFYDAFVGAAAHSCPNPKILSFLNKIEEYRKMQEYMRLDELIWKIYLDTNYLNYVKSMPDGVIRQANLKMLFERAKQYEKTSFKGLFNFIQFMEKLKSSSGDLGAARLIGENENVIRIMSIHKSKGLEFPVVFLSGTGKQFNTEDLKQSILIHNRLGIGPEMIDCERRISYPTIAKLAIKKKMQIESLGEEMRVLYVALTRAKEKLIITGFDKKHNDEQPKISKYSLLYAKSFLGWLKIICANNNTNDLIEIKYYEPVGVAAHSHPIMNNRTVTCVQQGTCGQVPLQNTQFTYPHKNATKMRTKISVSELKNVGANDPVHPTINVIPTPKFLNNIVELTGAEKR